MRGGAEPQRPLVGSIYARGRVQREFSCAGGAATGLGWGAGQLSSMPNSTADQRQGRRLAGAKPSRWAMAVSGSSSGQARGARGTVSRGVGVAGWAIR
jgi:hypothetical protein